jgi:hypothetical protein
VYQCKSHSRKQDYRKGAPPAPHLLWIVGQRAADIPAAASQPLGAVVGGVAEGCACAWIERCSGAVERCGGAVERSCWLLRWGVFVAAARVLRGGVPRAGHSRWAGHVGWEEGNRGIAGLSWGHCLGENAMQQLAVARCMYSVGPAAAAAQPLNARKVQRQQRWIVAGALDGEEGAAGWGDC